MDPIDRPPSRWARAGTELLEGIGAREVGEAEDGFESASLLGRLDGEQILLFVYDTPAPPTQGARPVGRRQIDGTTVRMSRLNRLRQAAFRCGRYDMTLRTVDGAPSAAEVYGVVERLLDVPDGCP